VRLAIVEQPDAMIAELDLSEDVLMASFIVNQDISHFEIRAFGRLSSTIDLKHIEFTRR
jgi:hypothetical protein